MLQDIPFRCVHAFSWNPSFHFLARVEQWQRVANLLSSRLEMFMELPSPWSLRMVGEAPQGSPATIELRRIPRPEFDEFRRWTSQPGCPFFETGEIVSVGIGQMSSAVKIMLPSTFEFGASVANQ